MATLVHEANGTHRIAFVDRNKRRRTIRLGKMAKSAARKIKIRIEELNAATITRMAPDDDTSRWVASLGDVLVKKLVKVGLIAPRQPVNSTSLANFLAGYLARRQENKPASRIVWGQVIRDLNAYFGDQKELKTVTPADALDFKAHLQGRKLAAATISKRLQHARMFFADALHRELIVKNPFIDVKMAAPIDLSQRHYVERATTERILAACDPTWRAIVALARYGGLRCPSEVLSLKWTDINWVTGRMNVFSPKLEHHAFRAHRQVPLFPRLREILAESKSLANAGHEYVINNGYREAALRAEKGWANANLRTQFERILGRAEIETWPGLFHALRSSCETEPAKDFPIHVVASWLGNTPAIAAKHYLLVRSCDFDAAIEGDTKNVAQKAAQSATVLGRREQQTEYTETKIPRDLRGVTSHDDQCTNGG